VDVAPSIEAIVEDDHGKDVGTCEASLDTATDSINITVGNAYPSYTCRVTFDVHNVGTIPVHVNSPVPDAGNPPWVGLENCYVDDVQLHNGEKALCDIVVHFTNQNQVDQGAQGISFGYSILAHQFNEDA
jgi:hypothetical protein